MPNWKKVVVSGSDAVLNSVTASFTGSLTGALIGTASWATNATTATTATDATTALTASTVIVIRETTNATYFPTFVDSNNGTKAAESVYTTAAYNFNPGTNTLIVPNISSTSITGSLRGTASYATQALSASYAPGGGAAFPFTGSATITGSLVITGSFDVGVPGVNNPRITSAGTLNRGDGISVDWINKQLVDASTLTSVDWESRVLNDTSAVTSIDWESRTLNDTSGNQSIDWESRRLLDATAARAMDYNSRVLIYPDGTSTALNYGTQNQISMSGSVLVTGSLTVSGSAHSLVGDTTFFAENNVVAQTPRVSVYSPIATIGVSDNLYIAATTADGGLYWSSADQVIAKYAVLSGRYSYGDNALYVSSSDNKTYSPAGFVGPLTGSVFGSASFATSASRATTSSFASTASFVNPLTQTLTLTGSLIVSGSSTFTNIGPAVFSGSVSSLNGYTGSLFGTASFATSASRAISSSFALTAQTLLGSVSTASYVLNTVTGTNSADLVYGNMADNDQFRIRVGGTATNAGFVEIATADDGTEPIHVRQYSGVFSSLVRTATLLDGSGNSSFPGGVTATSFTGSLRGIASTASFVNPLTQNVTITGSLVTSGSVISNTDGLNRLARYGTALSGSTIGTGVTAQTIVYSQLIPANTLGANDIIRTYFRFRKLSTNANATYNIIINTTNVVAGATTLATLTANTVHNHMKRDFYIAQGSATTSVGSGVSLNTDDTSNTQTLSSITWSSDQYIIYTVTLGTTDSGYGLGYTIEQVL